MTDDGDGALRISPGTMPNMTEIETALESGPFTLTSGGVMLSCKPRRWIVRELTDSVCEMLVLFEPECDDPERTSGIDHGCESDLGPYPAGVLAPTMESQSKRSSPVPETGGSRVPRDPTSASSD
jgi:hypothetical protein